MCVTILFMDIYLVGGAVRDKLLGRPHKERDWVVVGASPQQLLDQGYRQVGKDFPVFLHPETHEEYALARTERKTGKGYKGFAVHAAPDVTLEEDLLRRDLTINAIAENAQGQLIDPYNGRQDIQDHIFRHVSPAFAEDPVRILRVARLAATLPDFEVHPETNKLMQDMVEAGEVDALVPERVWQEMEKALSQVKPRRFFEVLQDCHALTVLFPEFKDDRAQLLFLSHPLFTAPQRFASLLYRYTAEIVKSLCERYHVPHEYRDLAMLVAKQHQPFAHALVLNSEQLLNFIMTCDALRRPERFSSLLDTLERLLISPEAHYKRSRIESALQTVKMLSVQTLLEQGLTGEALAAAIKQQRLNALNALLEKY